MTGLLIGAVGGFLYFRVEEAQVPSDANCSYLASPATDIMATIGGAWCMKKGVELDEPAIAGFGAAVVTIHLMQYLHHKANRTLSLTEDD